MDVNDEINRLACQRLISLTRLVPVVLYALSAEDAELMRGLKDAANYLEIRLKRAAARTMGGEA